LDVLIGLDKGTIVSQNGRCENITLGILKEERDYSTSTALRNKSRQEYPIIKADGFFFL
jgi:hypothetical protein